MQIGGKLKKKLKAPVKPQVVIQRSGVANEYVLLKNDDSGNEMLLWIGDPYAATKYESKYHAKNRTRYIADIPETRIYRVLEQRKEKV